MAAGRSSPFPARTIKIKLAALIFSGTAGAALCRGREWTTKWRKHIIVTFQRAEAAASVGGSRISRSDV
jgi:hypothetical protein